VGLHFRHQAIELRIAASLIESERQEDVGILLITPREPGGPIGPRGYLSGVDILANTIIAGIGVQLGQRSDDYLFGRANVVHLSGNTIGPSTFGIILRGEESDPPPTQVVNVRVTGNTVSALNGIDIVGPHVTVDDNQFYPPAPDRGGIAVRAKSCRRFLMFDNHIDGRLGNKAFNGIALRVCNDALLHGNVVRVGGTTIDVDNMVDFVLTDNTFDGSETVFKNCARFQLKDNDLNRALLIDRAGDGTIINNTASFLRISKAWGNWQILGNRVGQDFVIEPQATLVLPHDLPIGVLDIFTSGVIINPVMRIIEILGNEEALPGSDVGPETHLIGTPLRTHTEAARALALAGNIEASISEAVVLDLGTTFGDILLDDPIIVDEPTIILILNERPIDVQANDNRCGSFRIGHRMSNPGDAVETNTVVQATGNRILGELYVRRYPRRHVSQNVARSYPTWIASQVPAINADNLDLP
jgi:hypothetical protein